MLSLLFLGGSASYSLQENWSGNDFLSHFNFDTNPSPTHGCAKYSPQSSNLATVQNGKVRIDIDTSPGYQSQRKAIRLESKQTFSEGLFILDLDHMPTGCGVWPAFWMVGAGTGWPYGGEIDIIEYVHTEAHNQMALHTGNGCAMRRNSAPLDNTFTGHLSNTNCYALVNGNAGCTIKASSGTTSGGGFNGAGGGVAALEYVKGQYAKLWIWNHGKVPTDVTSGNPNPNSWGLPMSNFPLSNTGCGNKFVNQMIIINTELCGDWAGNVWNNYGCSGITGVGSCNSYVQNHGDKMTEAYWSINSLKIYSGSSGPAPPPSSGPSPPPVTPGGKMYCIPKPNSSSRMLGYDMDYACGQVTCDIPSTCTGNIQQKATYAISKFYALKNTVGGTCDFSQTAEYVDQSVSPYPNCLYGAAEAFTRSSDAGGRLSAAAAAGSAQDDDSFSPAIETE